MKFLNRLTVIAMTCSVAFGCSRATQLSGTSQANGSDSLALTSGTKGTLSPNGSSSTSADTCTFGTAAIAVYNNGSATSAIFNRGGNASGIFTWTLIGPDGPIDITSIPSFGVGTLGDPNGSVTINYAGLKAGGYGFTAQLLDASTGQTIPCQSGDVGGVFEGSPGVTVMNLPASLETCTFGTASIAAFNGGSDTTATFQRGGTASGTFTWTLSGPNGSVNITNNPAFSVGTLGQPNGSAAPDFRGLPPGNYGFSAQIQDATTGQTTQCLSGDVNGAFVGSSVITVLAASAPPPPPPPPPPPAPDTCFFGTAAIGVYDNGSATTATFTRSGTASGTFTWTLTLPNGATGAITNNPAFSVGTLGQPGGSATVNFAGSYAGNYTFTAQIVDAATGQTIPCQSGDVNGVFYGSSVLTVMDPPASVPTCTFGTAAIEVFNSGSYTSIPFNRGGTASGTFTWTLTGPNGPVAAPSVGTLGQPGGSAEVNYAGLPPGGYGFTAQILDTASGQTVPCLSGDVEGIFTGSAGVTVANAPGAPTPHTINIDGASYGINVSSSASGNFTQLVGALCNGQTSCSFYPFNNWPSSDPFPGQMKDFQLTWDCGGSPMTVDNGDNSDGSVSEAGFTQVNLSCP